MNYWGPVFQRVVVLSFLLALWLPLLAVWLGSDTEISQAEKRELAPMPEWSDSWRQYTRQLEAFYNDHFGFRRQLIRWYNIVRVVWLGESNNEWVLVGADGWLFQGGEPHLSDMRNAWPFSRDQLAHWAAVLSRKQAWLAERGIDYLFVVAPNKHLLYPEKLPRQVKRVGDTSRADQLIDYLRRHSDVTVLDLRESLRPALAQLPPYHKTDTHWNAFGAYLGYRQIMAALGRGSGHLQNVALTPDDFSVRLGSGGDLAQALDLREVLTERRIEPRTWRPRCTRNPTLGPDPSDRVRNQRAFTTTCAEAAGRALMFRDSYSLAMMPYLSETFGFIHYVPHSPASVSHLQKLVAEHRPELVIEQRSSRWLRTPEG